MSIYTIRSGGTAHPEDSFLQYFTDVVVASGVKDLSSDTHLKVAQKGGGADMSVDIAAGRAMIKGSTSNLYPVRNTATYNLAIAGNASGNPRIDAIVIYVDLAASPDTTASNVAKFLRVGGTPAGSPVAPTDGDIQTAVSGSNPFLRLADVRVDNGETTILDADITDMRVRTKLRTGSNRFQSVSGATTVNLDFSQYNIQEVTLDRATTTLGTPTGVSNDEMVVVNLKEDATGGRAVVWWANIDWYGGEPTLTPTASRTDSFGFMKRSTGRWDGYVLGQDKPA
jgi:hypothetical protein